MIPLKKVNVFFLLLKLTQRKTAVENPWREAPKAKQSLGLGNVRLKNTPWLHCPCRKISIKVWLTTTGLRSAQAQGLDGFGVPLKHPLRIMRLVSGSCPHFSANQGQSIRPQLTRAS